jgi:hypothetical protein
MKLGEYIEALQKLAVEHGSEIEVYAWPYDGQMHPAPAGPPTICYNEKHMTWLREKKPEWLPEFPVPVILLGD